MPHPARASLCALVLFAGACKLPKSAEDFCQPNPCTEANRATCVEESGKPRCLCDSGFIARPSGACEERSALNCPEHGGDSAEPDDCIARAKAIAPAAPARLQSIDPAGDYDFLQFGATIRHVYRVSVTASGNLLPRIDLFDQGGVPLAYSESVGQATLLYKARATANHLVRISHSPLDPSVAVGGYNVNLITSGQEDHGDLPSEATVEEAQPSTGTVTPLAGTFEYPGDQDWFSFVAQAGLTYRVTFDSTKVVPAAAIYRASAPQSPAYQFQQVDTAFTMPAGETAYLVLYTPPGLGSYAFTFTRP